MFTVNNTSLPNNCKCFTAPPKRVSLYEEFESVRNACHAINKVLIPDTIWPTFQHKIQSDLDKASHQSMLLLSYEQGHLHKLTSPVHRYLLNGNDFKRDVDNNYKSDLQEKWILEDGELRRHQLSRGYRGKLTELQCAEWLEEQAWKISNLEAWNGDFDIEAISPEEVPCAIEVKFIGQKDEVFKYFNGLGGRGVHNFYQARDYILLRTFESAAQFKRKHARCEGKKRIAVIVIEHRWWPFFGIEVFGGIDIKSPRFLNEQPSLEWIKFLKSKGLSDPYALKDIPSHLDEVWIVKESNGYEKEIAIRYSTS